MRTPWHGIWFHTRRDTLIVHFDHRGIDERKWMEVDKYLSGDDYMGRTITMTLLETWYFDRRVASYLDDPQ